MEMWELMDGGKVTAAWKLNQDTQTILSGQPNTAQIFVLNRPDGVNDPLRRKQWINISEI